MNKQDAIKASEHAIMERIQTGELYSIYGDIVKIINEIDKPQKVKIPKYVAKWIESQKVSFFDTSAIDMYSNLKLDNSHSYYHDVWLWVVNHHLEFIKAWHEGYEIVKKLYKVEIPNPNATNDYVYALRRAFNHTEIRNVESKEYQNSAVYRLTEEEIREDFEWAWQFAEEITE